MHFFVELAFCDQGELVSFPRIPPAGSDITDCVIDELKEARHLYARNLVGWDGADG